MQESVLLLQDTYESRGDYLHILTMNGNKLLLTHLTSDVDLEILYSGTRYYHQESCKILALEKGVTC